jgi:hypothetical protein
MISLSLGAKIAIFLNWQAKKSSQIHIAWGL